MRPCTGDGTVDDIFRFVRGLGSVPRRGDLRGVLELKFEPLVGAVLGGVVLLAFDLLEACGLGVEFDLAFGGLVGEPGFCWGVSAI